MSHAIAQRLRKLDKKINRANQLKLIAPLEYKDGRTKQAFKDECNIQKIMARSDIAGTISHLEKFEGVYADYADFDFHEQINKLTRGREIFDELPAEVRAEFNQSPMDFFEYVNDPKNIDRLGELLPIWRSQETKGICGTARCRHRGCVSSRKRARERNP